MKKFILGLTIAAVAGGLCSCGGNGKSMNADSDSVKSDSIIKSDSLVMNDPSVDSSAVEKAPGQDEELILANVRDIYQGKEEESCTPEFDKIINDADAKAEKEGNEVGYFDCDVLTYSQDPGKFKKAEVVSTTGYDSAVVKVYGNRYGENGYVVITVKLIDGRYYVDDIEGYDGKSVKQAAQKYLSGK